MINNRLLPLLSVFILLGVAACAAPQSQQVTLSQKSAVELRSIQTRTFETPDESKVYRAILAVMLDLGFVIETLEPEAGTVVGSKYENLYLTSVISSSNEISTTVRANAMLTNAWNSIQIDSAEFYQKRFFEPLSQALFLDAMYETASDSTPKKSDNTQKTNQ